MPDFTITLSPENVVALDHLVATQGGGLSSQEFMQFHFVRLCESHLRDQRAKAASITFTSKADMDAAVTRFNEAEQAKNDLAKLEADRAAAKQIIPVERAPGSPIIDPIAAPVGGNPNG